MPAQTGDMTGEQTELRVAVTLRHVLSPGLVEPVGEMPGHFFNTLSKNSNNACVGLSSRSPR